MDEVLRDMLGQDVFAYLDDDVVLRRDVPDHLARLSEVFARLKSAGLKVRLSKCHFLKAQESAFTSLKSALTSAPVLAFPDFNKPFHFVY